MKGKVLVLWPPPFPCSRGPGGKNAKTGELEAQPVHGMQLVAGAAVSEP